jgi:hypothetical protein
VVFVGESVEYCQPVLFHHLQQTKRYPAGALRTGVPLLHGGFADVEVAGQDRLADVILLANDFDLFWRNGFGFDQAVLIEFAHRDFADRAYAMQCARGRMNRFERVAFEFRFRRHQKHPLLRLAEPTHCTCRVVHPL